MDKPDLTISSIFILIAAGLLYGIWKITTWAWLVDQRLGIIVTAPFAAAIGYLAFCFLREEFFNYKRGYKVTTSGRPDGHAVDYWEGKKHLHFVGEHYLSPTYNLTVVDEVTWKREMPDWAKDRRNEIIERMVKRLEEMFKKKCELTVADLSNGVPGIHVGLREVMWPDKYKHQFLRISSDD